MKWLLGPYAEQRTYRHLVYLLIGLPLGILDFTILVTGFSLGLGMAITIIGLPVLVGTMLVVRGLADIERVLALSLLDAPLPRHGRAGKGAEGVFWARLKDLTLSKRAWEEVAFLLLRLPLGTIDFTVAVAIVSLALSGPAMMIAAAAGAHTEIGAWKIDTFAESLVFLPVSIVFILAGPRLILAWSTVSRHVVTLLLGRLEPREVKSAVAETLTRLDEADGFQILDDLELRFGRGPFMTPTRIEATLLALESTGEITSRQVGTRTLYALGGGHIE